MEPNGMEDFANAVLDKNITIILDEGEVITVEKGQTIIEKLRSWLSNPRVQIHNASGTEVIGLDHEGTISAVSLQLDENANITGNVTASYYCNATNCYQVADFLLDTSGGGGYAGASPWLSPSIKQTEALVPKFYTEALAFQIRRQGLFR